MSLTATGSAVAPVAILLVGLPVAVGVASAIARWRVPFATVRLQIRLRTDRLVTRAGIGGPVALLLAGLAAALGLGCGLALLSRLQLGRTSRSDVVYEFFLHRRAGWLTEVALPLTHLGDHVVLDIIAVFATGILAVRTRRIALPLLLVAAEVELRVQTLVAQLVPVVKPVATSVGAAGGCPSGGVARVVLTFGLIAYFLYCARPSARLRHGLFAGVGVLAFLEAWSRIYLGRHWTFDIVAGVIFGAFLFWVFIEVARCTTHWREDTVARRAAGDVPDTVTEPAAQHATIAGTAG